MTFDQLYNEHYVQIFKFCYRFTGEKAKARDHTQEAFVKLFLRMKNNSEVIENPRAWLYRVAGNICLNAGQTSKRRREIEKVLHVKDRENGNPESILLEKEQKKLLSLSLAKLKAEQRLLVLMYGDGLTYAEMAEATGIPVNSVGKTLWRAIEKISNEIKKHGEWNGKS